MRGLGIPKAFSFVKERNNRQACEIVESQASKQENLIEFTYILYIWYHLVFHRNQLRAQRHSLLQYCHSAHSLIKYLQGASYVPGTVMGTGDIVRNKANGLNFRWGRKKMNRETQYTYIQYGTRVINATQESRVRDGRCCFLRELNEALSEVTLKQRSEGRGQTNQAPI